MAESPFYRSMSLGEEGVRSVVKGLGVIFVVLNGLMGCSASYFGESEEFVVERIDYQTHFITKWDNSFFIDEVDCIRGLSPVLLSTYVNRNGSTKYIVQCVLHRS